MTVYKCLYDRLLMIINVIKLYRKKIAIKGVPINKGIKRQLKDRGKDIGIRKLEFVTNT